MAVTVLLEDAIEGILDAMIAAITAAVEDSGSGNPLAPVKAVIRGDRARPMPELPAIWLVPEPATQDMTTHGLREDWRLPVRIAAIVKSDDPEAAGRLCVQLTSRARTEVLAYTGALSRARRLGLDYVQTVTSTRFDATVRRSEENRLLHWADATVTAHFSAYEPQV